MSGDVQDPGSVDLFERGFGGLCSGKNPGLGEEGLYGVGLLGRAGERSEVDRGEVRARRDASPPIGSCPFRGGQRARDPHDARLAEQRVRDHERFAVALASDLQAQEVAARAEIGHRVPFDQVAAVLVDQRLERDEIELPVGREEQVPRVAGQVADRLHDPVIQSARRVRGAALLRVPERLAKGLHRSVDLARRTQVLPADRAPSGDHVGDVSRIAPGPGALDRGLRVIRPIDGEFDQS